MATFLLTWNPDSEGWPEQDHSAAVEATAAGRAAMDRWSVGLRKSGVNIGDRACLLRQRHERIVASGWFTSEIYEADHWDGSGRTTTYADIRFDAVLPVADRMPVEVLKSEVPAIMWDRLQGSGVAVAPPNDTHLDQLWATHLTATPYLFPEERFTNGLPKGRPN